MTKLLNNEGMGRLEKKSTKGDRKMQAEYSLEDAVRSFQWVKGNEEGYWELVALHPRYRPGRENYDFNVVHGTFPRVWYVKRQQGLESFIRIYSGSRLVCYSLNPRPEIFRNQAGYARSARETEIEISQNTLFDIDFEGDVSDSRIETLENWLRKTDQYFKDQGFDVPVRPSAAAGITCFSRISRSTYPTAQTSVQG